jgi:lantibiotic modifying enzyme
LAERRTGNRERLVEGARTIVRSIRDAARPGGDGAPCWLGPLEEGSPRAPAGPWLYGGTAGIALLLAASHRVAGEPGDRELCLAALAPLRRRYGDLAAERPERVAGGIGGLIGISSLIYSFIQVGRLLDEPALIGEAHEISSLLTPEAIAGDRHLDVTQGAAGALLVLLALDRVAPGASSRGFAPLELAGLCAFRLLSQRVSYEGRPPAWSSFGRPPLSGFAHGASGIALALLRLHERTGAAELRTAALAGLAYERTLYSPEAGNWRDLPLPDRGLINAWCYGAPGIALARLRAGLQAEDPEETAAALAATGRRALTPADHLCCGNMGRAEILAYAARRLGDPDLLRLALGLAFGVLQRRQANRSSPAGGETGALDPTFFKGEAGVAFALLHLAEPEALPFPLLLE